MALESKISKENMLLITNSVPAPIPVRESLLSSSSSSSSSKSKGSLSEKLNRPTMLVKDLKVG